MLRNLKSRLMLVLIDAAQHVMNSFFDGQMLAQGLEGHPQQ